MTLLSFALLPSVQPLNSGMSGLYNYCVPAPSDRVPMTLWRVPYIFLPVILLMTLAALARRPRTHLLRLAIFPFAVIFILRLTYGFVWANISMNGIRFLGGCYGIASVVQAIEFGLSPNGVLKVGEAEPGAITTPASGLVVRDPPRKAENGHSHASVQRSVTWNEHLLAGLELMTALRGIGWEFGTGTNVYVPPDPRDTTNTARFLRQSYRSFIINLLLTDFFFSIIAFIPNVGSPSGGSIFAFGSNVVEKYTISTAIHLITTFGMLASIRTASNFISIIAVGILGHHPTAWPPILPDSVLTSTSMHTFWSCHWHQILRHTFLVMGGHPLQTIFGTPGLVFGAFLASGVLHVWALYAIGNGTDLNSIIYFGLQPVALIIEKVWRRMTGRRVNGIYGWVWAACWMIGFGQFLTDSWHRRGFQNGVVPPALSPTQNLLFPILLPALEKRIIW